MSLKHRVNKLEQKTGIHDNPVTKITTKYINPDGSVNSTTVKKLIDGVWCNEKASFSAMNERSGLS